MRKVLFAVILVLVIVLPFGAMADKPEKLCTGVQVMIYGKPMPLAPEQCVPCAFKLCALVLDNCPDLLCNEGGSARIIGKHS